MARRADLFVSGLVLAAGGSQRLGLRKQLLPFDGNTMLTLTASPGSGVGADQAPPGGRSSSRVPLRPTARSDVVPAASVSAASA